MSSAAEREIVLHLRAGYRVLAVESFEEERALRLLKRVAERESRSFQTWSLASGWSHNGEGAGSLDAALSGSSTCTDPALFVILDAHSVLRDPVAIRRIRDSVHPLSLKRQTLVLLGPVLDVPTELEREAARIELPLPSRGELHKLFLRVVSTQGAAPVDEAALADCVRAAQGLSGAEAVRVLRRAWLEAGSIDGGATATIAREKRKALRRTPALSFHDTDHDLDVVGGLDELKRWLRERRQAFGEEASRFGLPTPRGLLLLGVQGCGKSLCAKSVAREWRFPLLRLDLGAVFGDPDRSPELTLREAMSIAESLAPGVLWIDEIEKGFAASDSDPRATRVFGSFLTWLAEKEAPVFVVATANDVSALPPELLRRGRFDELFFVDLPTVDERREILAIHLRARGRDPTQFALQELAEQAERLSGAEIEQVIASGLYTAFAEKRDLNELDVANAIQETVPLYDTYEERIKELRNWARSFARAATLDRKMVDLFKQD